MNDACFFRCFLVAGMLFFGLASMSGQGADCSKKTLGAKWKSFETPFNKGQHQEVNRICRDLLPCAQKLDENFSVAAAYLYIGYSAIRLDSLDEGFNQLKELERFLPELELEPLDKDYISSGLNFALGRYYSIKGWDELAISHYKETIDILLEQAGLDKNGKINFKKVGADFAFKESFPFNNSAVSYIYLEDYENALKYYALANEVALNRNVDSKSNTLAWQYHNMSRCYVELEKEELAISYFNKGMDILKKVSDKESFKKIATCYGFKNMALLYLNKKNPEKVEHYLNLAESLQVDHIVNLPLARYRVKNLIAQKNYDGALVALETVKAMTVKYTGENHPEMARFYLLRHQLFLERGNLNNARVEVDRAINVLAGRQGANCRCNEFKPADFFEKKLALTALSEKAKYMEKESMTAANNCYYLADALIQSLQHELLVDELSKYSLASMSKDLYENAIEASLKNNDEKSAIAFSQKSRSTVLLQQVRQRQAAKAAGIPEEISSKGKELKIKIHQLQKSREEALMNKDIDESERLGEELAQLDIQYQQLIESIEQDYPVYRDFKFNTKYISNNELQQEARRKNAGIFEYFLGKKHLYVFFWNGEKSMVVKRVIDESFRASIQTLRQGLSNPDFTKEGFDTFVNAAYEVGHSVFPEACLKELDGEFQRLIIIPDEELNLIPFETLLLEKEEHESTAFHKLKYMVNKYDISYLYSSDLLQYESSNASVKNDFLGVAPTFRDSTLNPLPFNMEEVDKIAAGFDKSQILNQTTATKDLVQEKIKDCRVAHFATHAEFNDILPLDSRIELNDRPLFIYELFSLEHKLDLAVLSACETALGERKKGEGMVSLSRAFFQSGCPSVVAGLWQVSDQKTGELMSFFYDNLQDGFAKDAALASAKRTFIKEATIRNAHPFYWSAFVLNGSSDPLSDGVWGNQMLIGLIGLALIPILLFLFFRKFRIRD